MIGKRNKHQEPRKVPYLDNSSSSWPANPDSLGRGDLLADDGLANLPDAEDRGVEVDVAEPAAAAAPHTEAATAVRGDQN